MNTKIEEKIDELFEEFEETIEFWDLSLRNDGTHFKLKDGIGYTKNCETIDELELALDEARFGMEQELGLRE